MIFVTGGTGLIGRHLAARLLLELQPQNRLAILVRGATPPSALFADPRVLPIAGDLRLPDLGISRGIRRTLQRSITGIAHCAASIRFDLPLDEARLVNVQGTQAVLDLASGCARLDRFVHVSTAFVAGRSPEPLQEARLLNPHGYFSTYQQSKHEAEELILQEGATRSLPAAVHRLSTVIGDSQTGQVEQYNHFHRLVRLASTDILRVLPGSPFAEVDMISTGYASASIAALFLDRFQPGAVHNICAGPSGTIPVRELLDLVYARTAASPPDLVSHEEFRQYVERRRRRRGEERRLDRLLQAVEHFLPYFSIRQRFLNERTNRLLGPPDVDSRLLLKRVLDRILPPPDLC